MNEKNILTLLLENKDSYISGQKISDILGISRNAVWKVINKLRQNGYIIDSISNRGYRITKYPDRFDKELIFSNISDGISKDAIFIYDCVASTNKNAKKIYEEINQSALIVSNEQTKGRGRYGRSFHSPKDKGIYMSLVFKPLVKINDIGFITIMAGISVCNAVEKLFNIRPKIKWINDIYIGDRKLAGILSEMVTEAESGQIKYMIIGIGINVHENIEDFSDDIKDIATSLNIAGCENINRNIVISNIVNEFFYLYKDGNFVENKSEIIERYKLDSYLDNKYVDFYKNNEKYSGKVLGLTLEGHLIIDVDGEKVVLNSGEVSTRRLHNER